MTTYNFQEQNENHGEPGEKALDKRLAELGYEVTPVTVSEQKLGLDRILTRDQIRMGVEYKTDEACARTHNVFIETISVVTENTQKVGWAKSSLAQYIIIYCPGICTAWKINTITVKNNLQKWLSTYKELPVQNDGYVTYGIALPLARFFADCTPETISMKACAYETND